MATPSIQRFSPEMDASPSNKRAGTVLKAPPAKKPKILLDDGHQLYEKGKQLPCMVYADLTRVHRKFQDQGYVAFYSGEHSGEPCYLKCEDCQALLSPNNWSSTQPALCLFCCSVGLVMSLINKSTTSYVMNMPVEFKFRISNSLTRYHLS